MIQRNCDWSENHHSNLQYFLFEYFFWNVYIHWYDTRTNKERLYRDSVN